MWMQSHADSEQECESTRPFIAFAQSPNIFATIKITTAPPRPPPPSRYTSEYPIAANGNMVIAKSSTMYSFKILGEFYLRLI